MPGLLRLDADRMWRGQELDRLWIGGRQWVKPSGNALPLTTAESFKEGYSSITNRGDSTISLSGPGSIRRAISWPINFPAGTTISFTAEYNVEFFARISAVADGSNVRQHLVQSANVSANTITSHSFTLANSLPSYFAFLTSATRAAGYLRITNFKVVLP